ncbi:hypothetical protein NFHSH190041_30690 [Shewanella sp. NFH-SH190041]|uniref:hypothetical protein n=1 Tax=Shewanella sp. NFH-SH190041 TaxID=2950245 RepID=UPI0021C436B6|nr:hypothetical protein [Shewanella sp. NFH-SH190041]BDM65617.1 hypothetical protein NFHSH190041_30690 [Shewanella sp. NFH-SH190041]
MNNTLAFTDYLDQPAIYYSSDSMRVIEYYATFTYQADGFYLDCLHLTFDSQLNGLGSRLSLCGLHHPMASDFAKTQTWIDAQLEPIMALTEQDNSRELLEGSAAYLTFTLWRDRHTSYHQIYRSKSALLAQQFSMMTLNDKQQCYLYSGNPRLLQQQTSNHITLVAENNAQLPLTGIPIDCSRYPSYSINRPRAYFYRQDMPHKVRRQQKAYLIKGDNVNFNYVNNDHQFCNVTFFNPRGGRYNGDIDCNALNPAPTITDNNKTSN